MCCRHKITDTILFSDTSLLSRASRREKYQTEHGNCKGFLCLEELPRDLSHELQNERYRGVLSRAASIGQVFYEESHKVPHLCKVVPAKLHRNRAISMAELAN